MRKLMFLLALVALAAIPVTGAIAKKKSTTKTFVAHLSGKSEVPGPGDKNGSGEATITVKGSKVCFKIELKNIAGTTAGHIHKGSKSVAGDVSIALFGSPSSAKERKGCVTPDAAHRKAFVANPGGFYVNVHNKAFTNGAARGQLRKK